MARARSKRRKDLIRLAIRLERRRLLREGLWDREKAELIAMHDYPFCDVIRGEVVFDNRGYVNPSLGRYP